MKRSDSTLRRLLAGLLALGCSSAPMIGNAADRPAPAKQRSSAPALLEAVDDDQVTPLIPAPETLPTRKRRAASISDAAKRSGSWTEWENGHAAWTCEYKDGRRHGKATRFFADGEGPIFDEQQADDFEAPFEAHATFVEGCLTGTCTIIDAEQRKLCELELVDDVLDGKTVWYYVNGQRREQLSYQDGRLHGRLEQWNEDGKLVRRHHYLAGRRIRMELETYEDGSTRMQGACFLPCEVTHTVFDWQRGDLRTEQLEEYNDKVRTGTWTWFYPEGQKQLEGNYAEDRPAGTFTWWYTNGQKERQGSYIDGLQHGKWSWWYESGAKKIEGVYAAGELEGQFQYWREDGIRIRDGEVTTEVADTVQKPSVAVTGATNADEPAKLSVPTAAPKKLSKPVQTVRRAPTPSRGVQQR